ncbi:MAG: hypothetical protein KJO75_20175 [Dactylosporangium sp.]|nr:hypothetical protein [Dactylosporangium sp.]
MSSEDIYLDPAVVGRSAAEMTAAADDLSEAWQRFGLTAGHYHAIQPWGNDTAGQSFNEQYLGGKDHLALGVIEATGSMVTMVGTLGPNLKAYVENTIDADEMIARWFDVSGADGPSGSHSGGPTESPDGNGMTPGRPTLA